jgi:hypothetical protein
MKSMTSTGGVLIHSAANRRRNLQSLPLSGKFFSDDFVSEFATFSPDGIHFFIGVAFLTNEGEFFYLYPSPDNVTSDLMCLYLNKFASPYPKGLTGGELYNYVVRPTCVDKIPF